jgi:hypothetical protein
MDINPKWFPFVLSIAILYTTTSLIFYYPLSLDSCPINCTLIEKNSKCYLVSEDQQFFGKGSNCEKSQNKTTHCYKYISEWNSKNGDPSIYMTNVTLSKFGSQFITALDSVLYVVGFCIGLVILFLWVIGGFFICWCRKKENKYVDF